MGVVVQIFRVLATVLNTVMFLSPVPTMLKIHRDKSTGPMPFLPLASMVSNAHIWMTYGYLSGDYIALFGTCAFGVLAACVYVGVYYHYTTEKGYARKCMAVFALVVMINSLYAILGANGYTSQSYSSVRKVVGYIGMTSSLVMYSSPLEKIRLVFRHRSAIFIPIQIVTVGAANSASWVVYSLLDIDWMVFAPNAFLLVLGLLQIALYWVFHPSKHPLLFEPVEIKEAEQRRSSVSLVLSPMKIHDIGDDRRDSLAFVALRSPLSPLNQV